MKQKHWKRLSKRVGAVLSVCLFAFLPLKAEDGHRLWLRYDTLNHAKVNIVIPPAVRGGHENVTTPTIDIAVRELQTFAKSDEITLKIDRSLPDDEGFTLTEVNEKNGYVIAAHNDIGLLYGAYHVLENERDSRSHCYTTPHTFAHNAPFFQLRLLNHWDNLDGSIERGYAGESIFWDNDNPQISNLKSQIIQEYARANASIGINGSVLNNVNASPKMLTAPYLLAVKEIADILRPYGIKAYLSINFATPMALGDTETADPLNADVAAWWQKKADEIYRLIPDFGGFLVKANSEGQPGPGDYHRSHADGANMLARALKPHGGIVMWRCFVYGANHKGEDRVMQAVSEFKPLDGMFMDNVILQTKNGPLDFQPREPYSPVFDQIKRTPNMVELQITQEYLGQSRHLVYLAPMWQEFFRLVSPARLRGIAGVANIGLDRNWCGHHFSQANWYAFGRLAWNPNANPNVNVNDNVNTQPSTLNPQPSTLNAQRSDLIAADWLNLTFPELDYHGWTHYMEESREACVNYMMPLGLHHIFKFDHHMGPEPDGFIATYPLEWCPVYYHKADKNGVGFDRTVATGTGATAQYCDSLARLYENIETCPEEYLLWFHHVPWTYRMKSGRTLWEELQAKYNLGVSQVEQMAARWQQLKPYVDEQRWREVDERLQQQVRDAREWRDVCLGYFGSFAN
ncbi:MAG: alpha-glucuronidase [Prevotella sp.]|nr:alpha-glucuronidase [Prevotella sp.]